MSCKIALNFSPLSSSIVAVYTFGVYTNFLNANSLAEKCKACFPPYNTQGTFPALRKALVDTLPTLSLLDPLIEIDFIIIV